MKPVHTLLIIGGVAAVGVWYYQREKKKRIDAATKQAADAVGGAQALVDKTFDAVKGFFSGPGSTQGPPAALDCTKPSTNAEREYCAGIRQPGADYTARWNMVRGAYQVDIRPGYVWECKQGEDRSPGSTRAISAAELAGVDRACSAVGA